MRYAHILMAVASEIWAMEPEKLMAVIDFLALQADGIKFSAEEIEARIAPQTARAVARREGAVAVIPLHGVISTRMNMMGSISGGGGTSAEILRRTIAGAIDDDEVKAVILDVDSPGGSVMGTDEVAQTIFSNRGGKPIIAQVDARAASAAYWIASAADEIVVTPSGEVGSIGVFTVHEDVSAALEKLGVKKTLISAGDFKGEGAPFQPLSDEARAAVQETVDTYYSMFVDRVAKGRNITSSAVRSGFGRGRMVTARKAVDEGMADRIGTMQETLARFGVAPSGAATEHSGRFALQRERRALAL